MSFENLIFRNGQPDCDDDPQGKGQMFTLK